VEKRKGSANEFGKKKNLVFFQKKVPANHEKEGGGQESNRLPEQEALEKKSRENGGEV